MQKNNQRHGWNKNTQVRKLSQYYHEQSSSPHRKRGQLNTPKPIRDTQFSLPKLQSGQNSNNSNILQQSVTREELLTVLEQIKYAVENASQLITQQDYQAIQTQKSVLLRQQSFSKGKITQQQQTDKSYIHTQMLKRNMYINKINKNTQTDQKRLLAQLKESKIMKTQPGDLINYDEYQSNQTDLRPRSMSNLHQSTQKSLNNEFLNYNQQQCQLISNLVDQEEEKQQTINNRINYSEQFNSQSSKTPSNQEKTNNQHNKNKIINDNQTNSNNIVNNIQMNQQTTQNNIQIISQNQSQNNIKFNISSENDNQNFNDNKLEIESKENQNKVENNEITSLVKQQSINLSQSKYNKEVEEVNSKTVQSQFQSEKLVSNNVQQQQEVVSIQTKDLISKECSIHESHLTEKLPIIENKKINEKMTHKTSPSFYQKKNSFHTNIGGNTNQKQSLQILSEKQTQVQYFQKKKDDKIASTKQVQQNNSQEQQQQQQQQQQQYQCTNQQINNDYEKQQN